eukprot:7069117-Lingulodinium_polyedra.AAC.1
MMSPVECLPSACQRIAALASRVRSQLLGMEVCDWQICPWCELLSTRGVVAADVYIARPFCTDAARSTVGICGS